MAELAARIVEAINETYKTRDMRPTRNLCEEILDPGIVLETDGEAFTEGEWRGPEGVVNFVANQMEVLDEMWLRVDEYLHVGADLVVGAISFGGRAQYTGIDVELHPLHVLRLDDGGKVIQWRGFFCRAQNLPTAGPQEEARWAGGLGGAGGGAGQRRGGAPRPPPA